MADNKNKCLVCDAELVYYTEPRKMTCMLCGREFDSNVECANGHFICDECHSRNAVDFTLAYCANTKSRNPIEIIQYIMNQPSVHMHGPEHHVMVGASLLAAYHNCGGDIDLDKALPEMKRRGSQVPGGACGFWGCCGAGVSAGMFVSIITKSTPLTAEPWGLSNLMTSRCLAAIGAEGGPRCCKRDSFIAIREAVAFVNEHFGIQMELPDKIQCTFSPLNSQCKGADCPFNYVRTSKRQM